MSQCLCVSPCDSRMFGRVSLSPAVWVWELVFPPAFVSQEAGGNKSSRSGRTSAPTPAAQAPGGPAPPDPAHLHTRPARSRRPTHLAATRRAPGGSGPTRQRARTRVSRTRKQEVVAGAALPVSGSGCSRPAPREHGDGPGRAWERWGGALGGGAWAVGPWRRGPGRGGGASRSWSPRPHRLPDGVSSLKLGFSLGPLFSCAPVAFRRERTRNNNYL